MINDFIFVCYFLSQKKTKRLLILPLLPDVGNTLMDYILNERPESGLGSESYVFLRIQAPHTRIKTTYSIISRLFKELKIKPINTTNKGLHTLRHSLVYRLLANEIPHNVISDVLGHQDKSSTKTYISLDDAMLKECSLNLKLINISKGGVQ